MMDVSPVCRNAECSTFLCCIKKCFILMSVHLLLLEYDLFQMTVKIKDEK